MADESYSTEGDHTGASWVDKFLPNAAAEHYQMMLRTDGQENQRYSYMQDGQIASNFMSQLFSGKSIKDLRSTGAESERFLAGVLENAGGAMSAKGLLGEGDAGIMMQGITQALGGGDFKISGMDGRYSSHLSGADGLGGKFSRDMFDAVQERFFPGGAAQRHRTQGLDKTDIGVLFDQLQQRGSFSGMDIGTVEVLDQERIEELSQEAKDTGNDKLAQEVANMKPGNVRRQLNKGTTSRINDMIEDSASALATIRDIFGDQSMDVLMQEAERISGMTFSSSNGAKAIKGRLEKAKIQAQMYGMNERAFMEFDFGISATTSRQMADDLGIDASATFRQAAAATPYISATALSQHREQQDAANAAAVEGRYQHVRTESEIAEFTAKGVGKYMAYNQTAFAAAHMVEQFSEDPADKKKLIGLIRQFGDERDPEKREQLRLQMIDVAEKSSPISFDSMRDLIRADPAKAYENMSQEMTNVFAKAFTTQETGAGHGVQVAHLRDVAGITKLTQDEVMDFHTTFGSESQLKIAAALRTDDPRAALTKVLEGDRGMLIGDADKQKAYVDRMVEANNDSDGNLGRQLRDFSVLRSQDRSTQNTQSLEASRANNREYLATWIKNSMLGNNRAKMTAGDMVKQAIAGHTEIEDEAIYRRAEEKGGYEDQLLDISQAADGGMVLDEKQKLKFSKMLKDAGVDLPTSLGVETEAEAFKKLETGAGVGEFLKSNANSDLLLRPRSNKKGDYAGLTLGSKGMKDEIMTELEQEAERSNMMELLGTDDPEVYDKFLKDNESTPSQLETADWTEKQKRKGRLTGALWQKIQEGGEDSKLNMWIDAIAKDPTSDVAVQATSYMKENAQFVLPELRDREQALRKEAKGMEDGSAEKADKISHADKIKEVRKHMSGAGTNHFLGILRIDDGRTMALHAADGGSKEAIDKRMA